MDRLADMGWILEMNRQEGRIRVIKEIANCSANEYIERLPDNSIDLVVLDPDYNEWGDQIKDGIIEESIRVLKPQGNLLCFTKQPFDYEVRQAVNPYFRREIVWTFTNGGAWVSNRMPLVSFQKIYWCVKSSEFFFNERTGLAYNESTKNFKRKTKVFEGYKESGHNFMKSEDGVWLRDHLHFNKPQAGKIPAKPKQLIEVLIRCFCPAGGVVYDPFSGTGVIALTANEMGMQVYATEIDVERCKNIVELVHKGSGAKKSTRQASAQREWLQLTISDCLQGDSTYA